MSYEQPLAALMTLLMYCVLHVFMYIQFAIAGADKLDPEFHTSMHIIAEIASPSVNIY